MIGEKIAKEVRNSLNIECGYGEWLFEYIIYNNKDSDKVTAYLKDKYPGVSFNIYGSNFGFTKDMEVVSISTHTEYYE